MRAALTGLVASAMLGATAQPVAAQTAADRADVRCVLVLTLVAREPKNANAAAQGVFYFVGKIDGKAMTGRLESLMLAESKALTTKQAIQGELTRCGGELNQRSAALRTMSQRLQPAAAPAKPVAK